MVVAFDHRHRQPNAAKGLCYLQPSEAGSRDENPSTLLGPNRAKRAAADAGFGYEAQDDGEETEQDMRPTDPVGEAEEPGRGCEQDAEAAVKDQVARDSDATHCSELVVGQKADPITATPVIIGNHWARPPSANPNTNGAEMSSKAER